MKYNSSIHHPASMNNKKSRAKTVRKSKAKANAKKTRKAGNAKAKAKRTGGFDIVERIIAIINKYLKKDKNDDYSQTNINSLAIKLANGDKKFDRTDRDIEEILNFYLEELDDVSGDEVTDQNILVLFNNHIDNKEKAYNCLFKNECE